MPVLNPNHVNYIADIWVDEDDLRIYCKIEAVEFERATSKTFELAAKRRIWARAEKLGAPTRFARGRDSIEVWDKALDYATDAVIAYTFRTRDPLPHAAVPPA